jgi:hypothetical protein
MQISERMTPLLCADAVGLVTLTRRYTHCGLTVRYVAYAPPSESVFRCQRHDDEIFQGNALGSLGRALNKKRLELELEAL